MSTNPELLNLLTNCHQHIAVCARTLFEEDFYAPFSSLHKAIFDAVDAGHKKVAIAAPRGIGKTTIARTLAQRAILFRDTPFIVYASSSATVAGMQTETMKRRLLTSNLIRDLFGSIKVGDVSSEYEETFSKEAWVAFGNTLVLPRGNGQQVRGLNWNGHRPGLIIVDDLEKKDLVTNEDNRSKLKEWFFSDLLKSVNYYDKDWRVIYIDTVKHQDSLLANLLEATDWHTIRLSICDENYKSNDVAYMTDEEIAQEVQEHREKGLLDLFYMERMNLPISLESASFKPEYFRYYEEVELLDKKKLETVIIVDPAKTATPQSADSAVVAVAFDLQEHKVYVRDVVNGKFYPDQLYDEIFSMAIRNNAIAVGIEVTSLNEFIVQPIKNEMSRRNQYYELIELKARAKKEDRIASMVSYYRQGHVYHNKLCCNVLEQQLLSFPRSSKWDVMDATAYFVEMLEMGNRYFHIEGGTNEQVYGQMEYEPLVENWRLI